MNVVMATVGEDDCSGLVRSEVPALEPWVGADTTVVDSVTGEVLMVVARYQGDLGALRRSMRDYPQGTTLRAAGVRNRSMTFGFTSRRVLLRRNGCRACDGSRQAPAAHAGLVSAAGVLAGQLAEALPAVAAADVALAGSILPEWRMADSPWTSGVLNATSTLPYHFDRNNLPTWSAMVVCRRGVRGGHLHVPRLGLVVDCRDGDVVMFEGWRWAHGVTPLRKVEEAGYRFTAVCYTVAQMRDCLPFPEEMARGRVDRSTREADLRSADERLGR